RSRKSRMGRRSGRARWNEARQMGQASAATSRRGASGLKGFIFSLASPASTGPHSSSAGTCPRSPLSHRKLAQNSKARGKSALIRAKLTKKARRPCPGRHRSPTWSRFHRLQFLDHGPDHRKPLVPELRVAGIKAERGQELLVMLGAAGLQHVEILGLELRQSLLVDRIERVHEPVAEGIGIDVEGRV